MSPYVFVSGSIFLVFMCGYYGVAVGVYRNGTALVSYVEIFALSCYHRIRSGYESFAPLYGVGVGKTQVFLNAQCAEGSGVKLFYVLEEIGFGGHTHLLNYAVIKAVFTRYF